MLESATHLDTSKSASINKPKVEESLFEQAALKSSLTLKKCPIDDLREGWRRGGLYGWTRSLFIAFDSCERFSRSIKTQIGKREKIGRFSGLGTVAKLGQPRFQLGRPNKSSVTK